MNRKRDILALPCTCGCCTFLMVKNTWDDGEIYYSLEIQDGRYDHNINTLWGRIKRAFSILFGKPVCFNEVFLEAEDYAKLCTDMAALLPETYETNENTKEIQS